MRSLNIAVLVFILQILTFNLAYSQTNPLQLSKSEFYPGKAFLLSGDTVEGYIFFKSPISIQNSVSFFKDGAGLKLIDHFSPADLSSFQIMDAQYLSVPFSGLYSSKKQAFIYCEISGSIELLRWYYNEKQKYFEDNDMWNYSESLKADYSVFESQIFILKYGGTYADLSSGRYTARFKKSMSGFVSDCQELAAKINNKQKGYQRGNIAEIVIEYNNWYMKNAEASDNLKQE